MTIFENCVLIDGTGAQAVENACVAVDRDIIAYAGLSTALPSNIRENKEAVTVDMKGKTILPGLFNCHVHLALRFPFNSHGVDEYGTAGYRTLAMQRRAMEALFCGVTTLRCIGESDGTDLALRDAVNKGMIMGPRILAAAEIIIAHGGHGAGGYGSVQCSGPYEFTKAVRRHLFRGVDYIKICVTGGMAGEHEGASDMQMTEEEIRAVVLAAKNAGKIVAGHIGNDVAVRTCVACGVQSIEHGYIMNKDTAKILAESDSILVPTLAVSSACDYLEKHNNPRYHIEKIRRIGETHMNSVSNAIEAGAVIAVGTDLLPSDPLDGTNATIRETELLREAGLSNLEAIKAATYNSALVCGVDKVTGTIEAGKQADIIAVSGRPDIDIKELRNIQMVLKGGSIVLSDIEGHKGERLSILPFGRRPEGASFIKW